MPANIASAAAHKIAAVLIEAGIAPPESPVTRSVKIEEHELSVTVTICRHQAATISPETLAKIEAMKPKPEPRLTQLQRDAIEAAPSRLHNPVSMKQLARLSGYGYNGHFRTAVNRCVELGLLVMLPGGVRKP